MPLLQRIYLKVIEAGADRVVVNVHHHAAQLKNFCSLLEARYGVSIRISDESPRLLETGGGIKKARQLFEPEPVLIHNCDILSNVSLRDFYQQSLCADATLLVSERKTSRYLAFDKDMRLVGWTNIDTGEVKSPYAGLDPSDLKQLAFSGIHVVAPSVFPLLQDMPERFGIIDFYLKYCHQRAFLGFEKKDLRLIDVGKLDTLGEAELFLQSLNQQQTIHN
jgi:NDP-sugar pyrophosphorylase family protein